MSINVFCESCGRRGFSLCEDCAGVEAYMAEADERDCEGPARLFPGAAGAPSDQELWGESCTRCGAESEALLCDLCCRELRAGRDATSKEEFEGFARDHQGVHPDYEPGPCVSCGGAGGSWSLNGDCPRCALGLDD